MNIEQMVEIVRMVIDGRDMVGSSYVTREQGSHVYEIRARLRNKDGIGCKDVMLASFEDATVASSLKNALNA